MDKELLFKQEELENKSLIVSEPTHTRLSFKKLEKKFKSMDKIVNYLLDLDDLEADKLTTK